MFNWITDLLMSSTSDAALEAAIYSASLASIAGMHQLKEPEGLQELAKEYEERRHKKGGDKYDENFVNGYTH